jgi:hypothetical protein
MYEDSKAVQLTGEELEKVKAAQAKVEELLGYIALVASNKLGLKAATLGPDGLRVEVFPNNSKFVYKNHNTGNCAFVYQNPPGICRLCTSDSETGDPQG